MLTVYLRLEIWPPQPLTVTEKVEEPTSAGVP